MKNLSRRENAVFPVIVLAVLGLMLWGSAAPARAPSKVVLAPLSGSVGVQMEQFVGRVIRQADEEGAALVVFELDTPGGLVEATRGIVQAILGSRAPVVMWVPPGGRAASAGAFMMQAAHVAAMASGTNVGAAHPVVASGKDLPNDDMKKKVVNDLEAQMRALVQLRGRNQKAAQRMIQESLSLTAHEALAEKVVDLVADDLDSLLEAVSGRVVTVDANPVKIALRPGMPVERVEMTWQEKLIQFLSSPDIAYLLLVGGLLALFYEIITPGGFVLGTTGAVMLLLGSIGLRMLPFSWAGVALVGAGVIVMGLDLLVGGMGILSLLGVAVLVAGGLFLFRAPGGELLRVSVSLIAGITVALGACFTLFAFMVARSLRRKVSTGRRGLIGLEAVAVEPLTAEAEGMVRCRGELWRARAEDGSLSEGDVGIVSALDGIVLVVRRKKES
ncbi:NfeD family protein [Fretibacterium sp. OH1220_COT-178]|uniref:NfeD family protein n=1 Tax=Fretibacterium sp. OH1220_COT-178 TaxID=2491047 RepID=UPI000F5EF6D7|nr:nodulation protein NfeD [Fretibacterium sp. OH1220_COT-178]RRD64193.1 nodulation protein NfeD [Fretibacterium sp. OH1220_COT-178]